MRGDTVPQPGEGPVPEHSCGPGRKVVAVRTGRPDRGSRRTDMRGAEVGLALVCGPLIQHGPQHAVCQRVPGGVDVNGVAEQMLDGSLRPSRHGGVRETEIGRVGQDLAQADVVNGEVVRLVQDYQDVAPGVYGGGRRILGVCVRLLGYPYRDEPLEGEHEHVRHIEGEGLGGPVRRGRVDHALTASREFVGDAVLPLSVLGDHNDLVTGKPRMRPQPTHQEAHGPFRPRVREVPD